MRRPRLLAAVLTAAPLLGPAAAARADCQAEGRWRLAVEWPARTVEVELIVATGDDGPTARWRGPQGELEGQEVRCEDASLSFVLEVRNQQEERVRLRYEGRLEDETLAGRLTTPRGLEVAAAGERVREEGEPE